MKTYYFPDQNITITPNEIIKNGFAGGQFSNNESQGSFLVDIILKSETTDFGFNLSSPDTMPIDFSVEEIDIWVEATLQQYEI
jgi:hypothetical protein